MQKELREYLQKLQQEHLAAGLETLSPHQIVQFFSQLKHYGPETLKRQRDLLHAPQKKISGEPFTDFERIPKNKERAYAGKMGCLVLAGGQATRLGGVNPKGSFPVSLVKKKSLFQLILEKTKCASALAGFPLPVALMTSPFNHQATLDFLETNHYFGLPQEQVFLFQQRELPFLDEQGNWMLESVGKLALGPDGNGGALKLFYESGIWKQWKEQGIECVNVILIDNPLADPFDAHLCSVHLSEKNEVTLKCIERISPDEKVGVLTKQNGKLKVVEYTELEDPSLKFPLASISLFCFSMPFIEKISSKELPWHLQKKKNVYKFETYIFDLLEEAKKTKVLVYPREEAFSPLKNESGADSIETVQAALLKADQKTFWRISGIKPPSERIFELDPAFYYPTHQLLEKWKGKPLPQQAYIL